MGNVAALDMGIVILRVAIFDRHNRIFPCGVHKQIMHSHDLDLTSQESDSKKKQYFSEDLSFYSKEHGGTFHFFKVNIMHAASCI